VKNLTSARHVTQLTEELFENAPTVLAEAVEAMMMLAKKAQWGELKKQ